MLPSVNGAEADNALATKMGAHVTDTLPQEVFNNYFSVGADAMIIYRFHLAREKNPAAFNSRLKNKARIGILGTAPLSHNISKFTLRRSFL